MDRSNWIVKRIFFIMDNIALKCLGLTLECLGCSTTSTTPQRLQVAAAKNATAKKSSNRYQNSPEIITEILSLLPVKSVVRMRCVCRKWNYLTRQRHFIEKHMISRGPRFYYISGLPTSERVNNATFFSGCDGLVLWIDNFRRKCCIVNRAMKKRLDLPNPHRKTLHLSISFVPSVGQYKLVSIYDAGKVGTEGWEIITPGIDCSWKPLRFPQIPELGEKRVRASFAAVGGFVHCLRVTEVGSRISQLVLSLDLEKQRFTCHKLGQKLYPVDEVVRIFNWDEQLAFGYRVQEHFHVIKLLESLKPNCRKKKIVLNLKDIEASKQLWNSLVPLSSRSGEIWFCLKNHNIFFYNIESRNIELIFEAKQGCHIRKPMFYAGPWSLVTFKGMRPYVC